MPVSARPWALRLFRALGGASLSWRLAGLRRAIVPSARLLSLAMRDTANAGYARKSKGSDFREITLGGAWRGLRIPFSPSASSTSS